MLDSGQPSKPWSTLTFQAIHRCKLRCLDNTGQLKYSKTRFPRTFNRQSCKERSRSKYAGRIFSEEHIWYTMVYIHPFQCHIAGLWPALGFAFEKIHMTSHQTSCIGSHANASQCLSCYDVKCISAPAPQLPWRIRSAGLMSIMISRHHQPLAHSYPTCTICTNIHTRTTMFILCTQCGLYSVHTPEFSRIHVSCGNNLSVKKTAIIVVVLQ